MVHRHGRVTLRELLWCVEGVCRQRSGDINARSPQAHECWDNVANLFVAEVAAFASVGVQARHQDAWVIDSELACQACREDSNGLVYCGFGDGVCNGAQGQVGGHQGDLEAGARKHHHHPLHSGRGGEKFRVASKWVPGLIDDGFVNRCGHQGVIGPRKGV